MSNHAEPNQGGTLLLTRVRRLNTPITARLVPRYTVREHRAREHRAYFIIIRVRGAGRDFERGDLVFDDGVDEFEDVVDLFGFGSIDGCTTTDAEGTCLDLGEE